MAVGRIVPEVLRRLTVARATNLDNLNATVSSRASQASVDAITSGYDWAGTGFQIAGGLTGNDTYTWLNITGAGFLVLCRSDTATYFSITVDGGTAYRLYPWSGAQGLLPLFIRFKTSLLVQASDATANYRFAQVVLD